ncbi:MAG TPA: LytTR family DNA-binding domain-containing protein [Cyclobacteriaceae bacterium]|nr:LytTR family DNA-binding domain-containing protein [Cyclobacteriaceae bacterium]
MNVLIVEDEVLAAERLEELIKKVDPNVDVLAQLDTVKDTVAYLENNPPPDLIFLDIQLADGKSFEVFEQVNCQVPVIFTTAYNNYSIKAFKHNSVDYLLKPIKWDELQYAMQKFNKLWISKQKTVFDYKALANAFADMQQRYKKRLLVKYGSRLVFQNVDEIACFYAEGKTVYMIAGQGGKKFLIDYSLDELESTQLNPEKFFRISRKHIVRDEAITEIRTFAGNRLALKLNVPSEQELVVSREKVQAFKSWLNQ